MSAVLTDVTLSVSEFDGRFEWNDFDLNAEVNTGTDTITRSRRCRDDGAGAGHVPRLPAPRFVDGGRRRAGWCRSGLLIRAVDDDRARSATATTGSSCADLAGYSVTSANSLVVTDSWRAHAAAAPIGDRTLPAAKGRGQQAYLRRAGTDTIARPASNLFFLPPASGRVIDATPVEDVLMMRDEMANLAWAIERSIESPIEQAIRRDALVAASAGPPLSAVAPGDPNAPPRYLLASTVPPNWVPLLPTQFTDPATGRIVSRLRRGAVRQSNGSAKIHPALGRVLNTAQPLLLYDEEVPREGVHVTVRRRLARWIDGSTHVWTAYRRSVGRGEGSSGLRFDQTIEPTKVT